MVQYYTDRVISGPFCVAIKLAPFNTFGRYIVQDRAFLSFYAHYKPLLALKMHPLHPQASSANFDTLRSQLDIFESFESKYGRLSLQPSKFTIDYEQRLIASLNDPLEVAWSANLACPWLYLKLARDMRQNLEEQHPCRPWVNFLASTEFESALNSKIELLHYLTERASPLLQEQMIGALRDALELELCFFNQAAYLTGNINKANL